MNNQYDLHTHTTCSDGTLTPGELVQLAADIGLQTLAVTDHDTVAGIAQARKHADSLGLNLIAGVEISSTWANMDIHIVGLCVDDHDPELLERLDSQGERRYRRAEAICQRLERLGHDNLLADVMAGTGGGPPGRPDIARVLVDRGICRSMNEAFRKYLAMGKQAYVKTDWPDIETAVRWIREAGGIAVLAHPSRYKLTRMKLSRLIAHFHSVGGGAIEVVTTGQDPGKTAQLAGFAEEYGLLASTGSDFHSPAMPWVQLGKQPPLPGSSQPVWQAFPRECQT
ncbi:MAG: PHP domain-containing protein [Ketobacteraceae bacterium]|nr:PHP domain-containing protein [Ketobacteraceae bacterium]